MHYTDLTVFLIKNKIFKWIIIASVIFFFIATIQQIKRFAFPKVELFELSISTVAPNYSVREVESNITVKIEKKLSEISGVDEYKSSSYENFSYIFVKLDRDTDPDKVRMEIKDKIDEITDFPDVVEDPPQITVFSVDNIPILELGIISPENDLKKIRYHALALKEEIRKLDEVSQVDEINLPEKKIWVYLDKKKMVENKVTFSEIITALDNQNISITAGDIKENGFKKKVLTLREYKTPEDIENVLVRVTKNYQSDDGIALYIKDIGRVEESFEEENQIIKFNGRVAAGLNVIKKGVEDNVSAAGVILHKILQYQEKIPNNEVEILIHKNDAEETITRIDIALNNALVGLVLVFIILVLFLHYKIAIWAAVGIPFVFAINVLLMEAFDLSINNISLSGIIITLGIIVDNAIIVGESIFRFKQKNLDNQTAVVRSLKSVIKPLIFALLTTVLSFLSMFFIPGIIGDFAIEIPLVVIFMLSASFLESTIFLPSHLAGANLTTSKSWGSKLIDKLSVVYKKILGFTLKRPIKSLLGIFFFFILAGGIAVQYTSFFLFPIDQAYFIIINGETADKNDSKEKALIEVEKIEKIIESLPEKGIVSSYKTSVGGNKENDFSININLVSYFDRQTTAEQVKNFIFDEVQKNPSIKLNKIDYFIDGGGPPQGKPIEVNVFGYANPERLKAIQDIRNELDALGYVSEVLDDYDHGRDGFELNIKNSAYYAGLDPRLLAANIRYAISGTDVETLQEGDDNLDIAVKYDSETTDPNNFLDGIFIRNNFGAFIELKNFIDQKEVLNQSVIKRQDGERVNVVTANFSTKEISAKEIYALLEEKFANISEKYPDVDVTITGEAVESANTFNQFLIAIVFSILGIYFLLVLQFNHFTQPFMVITAIPFGIIGIIIAFAIQGFNLSLLAMIGVLGFGGVVINASLIMVDFINRIKDDKYDELGVDKNLFLAEKNTINNKILVGANLRLRPILITTLTTLLGIMPTAYGILGKTDSTISPMTLAMFWGLFFGTLVSLFLIPLLYLVNEKITNKIIKK